MNTLLQNWKHLNCQGVWVKQASFGQLGLISDPPVDFQKSRNGLNDHKGPENINYTIVKYGETFYGHLMALTLAVVKINRF